MGYMNVPQGRNPWTSDPPMPRISERQPFPSYHTSTGNMHRPWGGDPETRIGQRLGQIAYGQSMYVSEWIRPQIQADEVKRALKAQQGGRGGASGGFDGSGDPDTPGPRPPSLSRSLQRNTPSSSAAPLGAEDPVGPQQMSLLGDPVPYFNKVTPRSVRVRRPSGQDRRNRGTFQQLSMDFE